MYVCVVSEARGEVLYPVVRALGSRRGFCPGDERGRAPAVEAAAVCELVDEEVEEFGVGAVLLDLAAPGGVAEFFVVCGRGVGGVVVACAAGGGCQVQSSAVSACPAGVADAGLGDAEAVETAVFVCRTWLCGGKREARRE